MREIEHLRGAEVNRMYTLSGGPCLGDKVWHFSLNVGELNSLVNTANAKLLEWFT